MYYVLRITRIGENIAKEVYDFADLNAARSNLFFFLSSSYANPELDYFMGEVIDVYGNILHHEMWSKQS